MGYNNLSAWKNLVKLHIVDIAEAQKIDLKNFRWYAAYHQKENNPHVHIVVYSENPKEGNLTKQGIEKIRESFENFIFKKQLYKMLSEKEQVAYRKLHKAFMDYTRRMLKRHDKAPNYAEIRKDLKQYFRLKDTERSELEDRYRKKYMT